MRSQFATSKKGRGGRRYLPYVFTQEGVAMLSSVLHSRRAIAVNIQIMRAFVRLRQLLGSHKELAFKLKELESKIDKHDEGVRTIFEVIKQLMAQPEPEPEKPKTPIGFHVRWQRERVLKLRGVFIALLGGFALFRAGALVRVDGTAPAQGFARED